MVIRFRFAWLVWLRPCQSLPKVILSMNFTVSPKSLLSQQLTVSHSLQYKIPNQWNAQTANFLRCQYILVFLVCPNFQIIFSRVKCSFVQTVPDFEINPVQVSSGLLFSKVFLQNSPKHVGLPSLSLLQ